MQIFKKENEQKHLVNVCKLVSNQNKRNASVVTIAIICSTLASLCNFQYFSRPIYITQTNIYDEVFSAKIVGR